MVGFVAVHLGAGTYARSFFSKYEKLGKDACNAAVECLRSGGDAVEAVTKAVCVLEDSPLTNAGRGSNLNMKGRVECDASIMAVLRSADDGEELTDGQVGRERSGTHSAFMKNVFFFSNWFKKGRRKNGFHMYFCSRELPLMKHILVFGAVGCDER